MEWLTSWERDSPSLSDAMLQQFQILNAYGTQLNLTILCQICYVIRSVTTLLLCVCMGDIMLTFKYAFNCW